jgi:protein TonB
MPASYRSSSYDARPPLRERIAASSLSLSIIALIIVALLWVTAAPLLDMGNDNPMTTFNVGNERAPAVTPPRQPQSKSAAKRPAPPPPANRPPPPPVTVPNTPGMIVLSKDDFAASDIGAIKKKAGDSQGAEVADAGGGGDKPVYGPSEAPGGRTLHAADWYREPTRAEMITYMPPRLSEGWGVIACKTADRYHVEDCREIGESPGSGIARGMRRAAFQFLVRPPMVNGQPQLGAWVRIRFDIVQGITK